MGSCLAKVEKKPGVAPLIHDYLDPDSTKFNDKEKAEEPVIKKDDDEAYKLLTMRRTMIEVGYALTKATADADAASKAKALVEAELKAATELLAERNTSLDDANVHLGLEEKAVKDA